MSRATPGDQWKFQCKCGDEISIYYGTLTRRTGDQMHCLDVSHKGHALNRIVVTMDGIGPEKMSKHIMDRLNSFFDGQRSKGGTAAYKDCGW